MACAPLPATFIFARVAAESRGLKSQKIHVRKLGTFTKNLWACGAGCGGARGQGVCQPACGEGEEGGRGCVRGTRGSGSGICCWLRRLRPWSSRCGCSSRRPRSLSPRARAMRSAGVVLGMGFLTRDVPCTCTIWSTVSRSISAMPRSMSAMRHLWATVVKEPSLSKPNQTTSGAHTGGSAARRRTRRPGPCSRRKSCT